MIAKITVDKNTFILEYPYYKKEWTDYLIEIGGYFSDGTWTIPIGKLAEIKSRIPDDIEEQSNIVDDDIDISTLDTEWPGPPLRDYQKMGSYLLATHRLFGLFDGCGLGKTIETIGAMVLLDKPINLIVSEKKALQQWQDEILRFSGNQSIIVHGTKRKRLWKEAEDHRFIITNYHSIIRDYDYVKNFDIDVVVFDEGSRYMRNRETKMAKMGRRIKSTYKWVLTGSPIENNLADLYSIYEVMDPTILGDWNTFKKRHIRYKRIRLNKWKSIDKIVGYNEVDVVKKKVAPHFIRRTAEEVGKELPDIVHQTIMVELSDLQGKLYKDTNKSVRERAEKTNQRLSNLGELIKLRRICDSSQLGGSEKDESTKLDEIASMIHENSDRKVIVFSQWTDPLQLLIDRLEVPYAVGTGNMEEFGRKDHATEVELFNNDVNVMIASDAMSRSVNLQAASIVINMDLPWNPQTIYQRIHRARRIGSEHNTVFVYDFICKDTIEETMLPVLQYKENLGKDMIDENIHNDYGDIEEYLNRIYRSEKDEQDSNEPDIGGISETEQDIENGGGA